MRLKTRERAIWEREEKKKQQQHKIAMEREERQQRRVTGGQHDDLSDEAGHHGEDEEEEEEEDWVFDCVCGVHGNNLVRIPQNPSRTAHGLTASIANINTILCDTLG
jgi:hypothetical protein